MKKVLLILFIATNILLIATIAGTIILSEMHPLRPGNSLYAFQDTAEQWRLQLSPNETQRTELALELIDRRLADLARANTPSQEISAAEALDQALNEAVRRIGTAPQAGRTALFDHLGTLLDQAKVVVADLKTETSDSEVTALKQKIAALQAAETPEQIIALVPPKNTLLQALTIPFLGQSVEHGIYPLTGGHAEVGCKACHPNGQYADIGVECSGCHELPFDPIYADHFAGACEDCHTVDDWSAPEFDHVGIVECQSCHLDDSPDDHYARKDNYWAFLAQLPDNVLYTSHEALPQDAAADSCAPCHLSTSDWEQTTFDHIGFTDCESCHLIDNPDDHYDGLCTVCHETTDWALVEYDHQDVAECRSCHLKDSPTNHYVRSDNTLWFAAWLPESPPRHEPSLFSLARYPDTCVNCHPDTSDWNVVAFDHQGWADCASCHASDDGLEEHYAGQCSKCHDTVNWQTYWFDHSDFTDCASCHSSNETPDDHYAGQCSRCHNTEDWENSRFDHTGFSQCKDCHADESPADHYPGACNSCHNTENWEKTIFSHIGFEDCTSCHSQAGHYRGQCSNCHDTENWNNAWFNHAGYSNCVGCHEQDAPNAHYGNRCSSCHNTSSWGDIRLDHSGLADCRPCHTAPPRHFAGSCGQCHNTVSWHDVFMSHNGLTDCQTCHTAPAAHYNGQCSNCHDTDNWQNATFSHSGLIDCQSCHTAPAEHWPGQCSECHDTENWYNAEYIHTVDSDCQLCHTAPAGHYEGTCSNCHDTTSWSNINMSHSGLVDCQSCHTPPDGHWPGQCSNCHDTTSWSDYTFDHTGYNNCNACHVQERPPGHARGQCSRCHTTDGWTIPGTPTPTETPDFALSTPTKESIRTGRPPATTKEPPSTPSPPPPQATSAPKPTAPPEQPKPAIAPTPPQ